MTWLGWRLSRLRALIGTLAVAALGVALAGTGPQLAHLSSVSGGAMRFLTAEYGDTADKTLYLAGAAVVLAAPALLGIFWGAPLISREAETGTYKLAWSQSVSKQRWFAAKLAIAGLSAMALAGLLSLALTWWAGPIDRATAMLGAGPGAEAIRFNPVIFATRGVAPVGYAAFAFMLGVTFGVLIRRTVPAMAATLAVFTAAQIAWPLWVRAHLIAPVRQLFSPTAVTLSGIGQTQNKLFMNVSGVAGNWVLGSQPVTASGQPTSILPAACHNSDFGPACLASHGIRVAVSYQPASRFWEFQWTEAAIYLGAALALVGFCIWWLHRRRLS